MRAALAAALAACLAGAASAQVRGTGGGRVIRGPVGGPNLGPILGPNLGPNLGPTLGPGLPDLGNLPDIRGPGGFPGGPSSGPGDDGSGGPEEKPRPQPGPFLCAVSGERARADGDCADRNNQVFIQLGIPIRLDPLQSLIGARLAVPEIREGWRGFLDRAWRAVGLGPRSEYAEAQRQSEEFRAANEEIEQAGRLLKGGQWQGASDAYDGARRRLEAYPETAGTRACLSGLAAYARGSSALAVNSFQQALSYFVEGASGEPSEGCGAQALSLTGQAQAYRAMRQDEQAQDALERARPLAVDGDQRSFISMQLGQLRAAMDGDQDPEARRLLWEALGQATSSAQKARVILSLVVVHEGSDRAYGGSLLADAEKTCDAGDCDEDVLESIKYYRGVLG